MNTQNEQTKKLTQAVRQPLYILRHASGYQTVSSAANNLAPDWSVAGYLPALYPEWLGDKLFLQAHNLRFPYVVGDMAHGITTAQMVVNAAKAGLLGFFGAAGVSLENIENSLWQIKTALANTNLPWGSNLIFIPDDPDLERKIAELYVAMQVPKISASAFMKINKNLVFLACNGLSADAQGNVARKRHIFAKISHPNIAAQFMSPAPKEILQELVAEGRLTAQEANLALTIPLAEDVTVEGDSGGHTDNRPLGALMSAVLQVRSEIMRKYRYKTDIRVGAAGGIGTPQAAAAAFSLGADYIVTGSINQSAVESGISTDAKNLLAQADITDVMMAPAADMFELGVKVQVLKKGTMFPVNAAKLYEWYVQFSSLDELPKQLLEKLERNILRTTVDDVWLQTKNYFNQNNPKLLQIAEQNPKQKMALIFRWYLGNASRWSVQGETSRRMDYLIYCGPAMGAFNSWVKSSFLEDLAQRSVAQIAYNLLEGAAVMQRVQQCRSYGLQFSTDIFDFRPTYYHNL